MLGVVREKNGVMREMLCLWMEVVAAFFFSREGERKGAIGVVTVWRYLLVELDDGWRWLLKMVNGNVF